MKRSSLLLLPILLLATGCGKKPSGYDRVHLLNMGFTYCCRLDECSSTSKGQHIKCTLDYGKSFEKTIDGIFSQGTYILIKEGAYCPICFSNSL